MLWRLCRTFAGMTTMSTLLIFAAAIVVMAIAVITLAAAILL